ncbi:thiamine pyrophosphate-binding protein [Streptomyces sp. NPDC057638]|uniref:thiamine pyrophosphate-binding protein n=1 Tax=Streptomyces sp. NPDC057638 TaxID=3346190 RepID=UPI0036A37276
MTTLAAAVGQILAAHGVRHAFGVVGGGNILATAALTAAGVHYTAARHEGGAMAMADACFRATGQVALCTTTHGPGLTNTLTALADAAKSRSGVLLLCGDAPLSGPRPHDVDQSALLATAGARTVRLSGTARVYEETTAALAAARDGHGPVALLLPGDLAHQVAPALSAAPGPPAAGPADTGTGTGTEAGTAAGLEAVLAVLATAHRPLLLAGLGAWRSDAAKVLAQLGERLGALLTTTVMAGGLFGDSPWSLGVCGGLAAPGAAALTRQADVVLAFGASLDTFTLHGGRVLDPAATVIQVERAPGVRAARADLVVRGDAHTVAVRLLEGVERAGRAPSAWRRHSTTALARARRGWAGWDHPDASGAGRIDPRTLTRALAALLPAERTLVLDGGHFIAWPTMYWPAADPAGFVFTGAAFQSIGLGLAGAVGAAVGRPGRLTVLATGDGGTLMGLPELETLIRSGRSALVVVYDDAAYGFEEHMYAPQGADRATTSFADTDFAGVARALGARAHTVRALDALGEVERWLAGGSLGTLLLDCKVVPHVVAPFLADLLRRG